MRSKALLATVALAAALSPSLGGCSDAGGTPTGQGAAVVVPTVAAPRTPTAVPESGLTRGLVLPLEAYEETYPEYIKILTARLDLETSCMAGFGYDFAPKPETDSISYDASNMDRRYGLSDPVEAAQQGYFVPMPATAPTGPNLSKQESIVLTGAATLGGPISPVSGTYAGKTIPAGGCAGQADRLLGSTKSTPLVDQLDNQSLTASQKLPVVSAVIRSWSACMKQDGYAATSPLTVSLLTQQAGALPGSTLDRKIAVADVTCKQRTNLVEVWFTAESALQKQYIAADIGQLRSEAAALTAVEQKADAVVAGR